MINQYIGESKNVVIPSEIEGRPVANLKGLIVDGFIQGVFQGMDVETVTIPETVMVIGSRAFKDCADLSSVKIKSDSALQIICVSAFENCSSLKEFNIENAEKLKTIEAKAFYNCSIERMKFPSNLETIGQAAFAYCTSLKVITVPAKLDLYAIDEGRFYENPSLEQIIFEEGREEIRGYAFFGINSPEIIIPKSVKRFTTLPFFIYGETKFIFLGDCPEIIEEDEFMGTPTVYYDPSTDGWDSCVWKQNYMVEPIK